MWMRCEFFKRATSLLALFATAAMSAVYSVNITNETDQALYYRIRIQSQRPGGQSTNVVTCTAVPDEGISFEAEDVTNYRIDFYTSDRCSSTNQNPSTYVTSANLFRETTSADVTISIDRNRMTAAIAGQNDDPVNPWGPQNPGDNPGGPGDNPGQDNPGNPTPANGRKQVVFFTPWTNTNAILYVNGDSISTMSAMDKYCGWFIANSKSSGENLNVYFKQTIGGNFVGAEGLTKTEPTTATEISLDSVAALSDTIWVKGNQEGAPEVYSQRPAGILGDCPLKKLPVMMFDWLHGNGGDGDGEGRNGNPANGISADFGSGGCSGSPMRGMVEPVLGANGVPVPATPFPENCRITEHLAYWFLPESLGVDAQGNKLTNMTCRDLYISMDDEGFWLAEVSGDAISKGNEANKDGMFLLDDFKYLDEAGTVPNPYYDTRTTTHNGRSHNFGFTMKVQATFEYVKGQYFDFYGDDDVWVFINNRLVVDIGGQHGQVAGAVNLDTLNLVEGQTYPFHIFYAERHTSSSNFRMHTSIDLKTEASIMLKNSSDDPNVIGREIWQRVRKSKLACDFSSGETELSLERGESVFTLFGGNLPDEGVDLDSAGLWFGGITVNNTFDGFDVNKEQIKINHGLAPGTYFIRVTLKSDNSQHKDVYFVVGAYDLPKLVYTDAAGNVLGENVNSTQYQLNMSKDTMWVGQSYKVYVQYTDDWANPNETVYLSTNDNSLIPCDSLGNPITEIQLRNYKGSFYVKAVGEVWGGILYVKGQASANTATWSGINFALPPVPQIETAYMYDRDGDGRGDSIWIKFDGTLGGKNSLDSAKFTFGSTFNTAYTAKYRDGSNEASVVAKGNGFGSAPFTGDTLAKVYTGLIKVWYTYIDNGHRSIFPAEGRLQDQVGPIVTKAEVSYMKDGNTQLVITFSESIKDDDVSSDLYQFHVWKNGIMSTEAKSASDISVESPNQWKLIFPKGAETDVIPAVGDSVRFTPPPFVTVAYDMMNVTPHANNPWVRITGEQKVNVTSPGVVTLNPESPTFNNAREIIRSEDATVPRIIQDPSVLTAEQAASVYGTQGHFLGDLNMAELVENEITEISRAVQGVPYYTDKDEAKAAEETGIAPKSYSIEEIIAAVDAGSMSINEAKKKFGLSDVIVDAYKNGILNSQNIDNFQRGTKEDIKQIVEAVAQNTELYYKATYYSSLGEFVNSNSDVITCNGDIFKENGQGTCLDNNGKLFLAWNMRAQNGRLASTGVYIARLEYRIKVGSKTVVNRTQDFLWGVRRGKANAIDLGL